MKKRLATSLVVTCAVLLCFLGCNRPANQPVEKTTPSQAAGTSEAEHGHAHGAGPHGGAVADWGGGKYHVEFTVDHDQKEATVYILSGDEKTPAPVKADKLLLTIKQPSFQVELMPAPQKGEIEGASRFVGTDEKLGVVQEFAGTISGEVEGTPYAGDFAEEAHADQEHK